MILRKPYAFLIKHFRLIHLIICLLLLFLINNTNGVLDFFKGYISGDITDFVVTDYINIWMYLAIIVIILLVLSMILLMRKKDKPLLIYILTIVEYSAVFVCFAYASSIIQVLQRNILDQKTIRLARDVVSFALIGQWLFLIPYAIRAMGFDIKKFDFKRDLKELNLTDTDNEEFELELGIDKEKINIKLRRKLRELKYYYKENKLYILIILFIVLAVSVYSIVNSIEIVPKYKENEIVKLDNYYTLKINNTYLLNKDNNGKKIKKNDDWFLVVNFTINSMYSSSFQLDIDKFILKINNEEIMPTKQYYNYFTNYGIGYKSQKISLNDEKTFILVYEIPNKYKESKKNLEYNYRYDYSGNSQKMIKKIFKLSPSIVE